MENYDHLLNNEDLPQEDSLTKLRGLAELYKEKEKAYKEAEKEAKELKKQFNKVSMELIPDAMTSVGMTSFKLDNGEEVSYSEELNASIKDQGKLTKFLESRGDDALIKTTLELGKIPQNILHRIMRDFEENYGLVPEVKESVHHKTLGAYFKELCGLKKGSVAKMTVAEIDKDMVNIFTYFKTKIK